MNQEKVVQLKRLQGQVRTGGKGTVRRKVKKHRKVATTDDKKLQACLKRLGVNPIPGIEEVVFFKDDRTVRIFKNPKVQATVSSNTFVVTGASEVKDARDMIPGFANAQGGQDDEIPDLATKGINFEDVATKADK